MTSTGVDRDFERDNDDIKIAVVIKKISKWYRRWYRTYSHSDDCNSDGKYDGNHVDCILDTWSWWYPNHGKNCKKFGITFNKKKAYRYILPTLSELRIGDINSYFSAWYKYRCETGFGWWQRQCEAMKEPTTNCSMDQYGGLASARPRDIPPRLKMFSALNSKHRVREITMIIITLWLCYHQGIDYRLIMLSS